MKSSVAAGVLLPVLLLSLGCGKRDPWVARVGNERIRKSELVSRFVRGKPANILERVNRDKMLAELQRLVDERLELLEAYRQRLDRDPAVVARLRNEEAKRLYEAVIDQQVVEKAIPKSERRAFYQHLGVQVRARHLFLALKPNPSEEELKAVRQRAEALRDSLRRGADFAQLVRRYSDDKETVADGGDLGWFDWSPNPVQTAAFALKPGEISEPVRSRFGYHLIQVEERRAVKVPPFERMDGQIKSMLRRIKEKKVTSVGEAYIAGLLQRYHFRYDRDNIERIAARLAPADSARKHRKSIPIDSLLTPEDRRLVLARYDGAAVRAADLARYPNYPASVRKIRDWIARRVRQELVVREGRRLGLDKTRVFQQRLAAFRDELLRKAIEDREVNRQVAGLPKIRPTKKNLALINTEAQRIRAQRKERLRAWLAELRQRYPVVIDERRLKEAVAEVKGRGN